MPNSKRSIGSSGKNLETGIAGNSRKLNYAWKIIIYT